MTVSYSSAATSTTFVSPSNSPPNSPPRSRDARYQKGDVSLGQDARTAHVFRSTDVGNKLTISHTEAVRLERRAITDLRLDLVSSPELAVVTYAFFAPIAVSYFPAVFGPVLLPTGLPLAGFYYYRRALFEQKEQELYTMEKYGLDMGFTQVEAVEYAAWRVVRGKTHEEAVGHVEELRGEELRRQNAN